MAVSAAVNQATAGNKRIHAPEDFVAFVHVQRPNVLGALILYLQDRAVAEELTQEAFARALLRWDGIRTPDRWDAWVHRVAFNLAKSHLRRLRIERRVRSKAGPPAPSEPDRTDALAVRAAVAALPRRERAVTVLRFYCDLKVREIADVMDWPEGTVKTLLRRAIAALSRELGPLDEKEMDG